MARLTLKPTEKQNYILLGGDLVKRLDLARTRESEGDFEGACNIRYHAFQEIVELLPEEEQVELDASHANTAAAMDIIHGSAVDNFLAGDAELAAAQLELLLECDSEDHTGATPQLALCYIALGEWECLAEIISDIDEKSPMHALVNVWLAFAEQGEVEAALAPLRRHAALAAELRATEHPADEQFLADIASERPSAAAQARELYLRCEPLFVQSPDFVAWLRDNL